MIDIENISFATKCWGGDWVKFLSGAFERKSSFYPFKYKTLYLNNDVPKAKFPCNTSDVIPKIDEVLEFFNLKLEDFDGGFWYSIAELTAIYECKTDYLCWVQGDCISNGDWVTTGLDILKNNPNISVVSPSSQCNTWHDENGLDQYFSDQAFLIRTDEFIKQIYNLKGQIEDYPKHGGNSFEHMVAKYLRENNKYRKVLDGFYLHHEAY